MKQSSMTIRGKYSSTWTNNRPPLFGAPKHNTQNNYCFDVKYIFLGALIYIFLLVI